MSLEIDEERSRASLFGQSVDQRRQKDIVDLGMKGRRNVALGT